MRVLQGTTHQRDARAAVAEATADWPDAPEIVLAFCSVELEAQAVSAALAERFPGAQVAGCTTAGEHVCGTHANGSLALTAIWGSTISWAVTVVPDLGTLDEERATETVDGLLGALDRQRDDMDPSQHFALLLIDGLSMAEERVCALLADALEGIRMAGGSAGDDLGFHRTFVFDEHGAHTDAAILVVADRGAAKVQILKHQHYVTTPRALCVTKADPATRTVLAIDGLPAVEAYGAALGLAPHEVTDAVTFLHPLTFSCNGDIYVRSIQRINADGSLTLYCGIEEGMVLEIGGHEDMREVLRREMDAFVASFGRPDLLIGFNCILRALEAHESDVDGALGAILRESAGAMIGFDTYGEQIDGLHVNQTLVAVAIQEPGEER
jgi:hypothetical protein